MNILIINEILKKDTIYNGRINTSLVVMLVLIKNYF